MTKLYQLHIDKEIVPDWSGDIYHSRLYHSSKACMEGCLTEEIFWIGRALWRYGDFTEDAEGIPDLDCGENEDELKDRYEAGDKKVIAYIENVRRWLRKLSNANKSFYGDWSLEWRILAFELVRKS